MSGHRGPRVVVGVSGSITGLQALRQAVTEARRRGAALWAVRAWDPPAVMFTGDWYDAWNLETSAAIGQVRHEQALETVHEAFAAGLGVPPDDLDCRQLAVPGPAGPALVHLADHSDDLLVVGASVKRSKVVRHCQRAARCPMMVVPPPPLARVSSRDVLRHTRQLLAQARGEAGTPG